ncbi:short fiber 2 [Rhesus adenovirus 60]|nr:short fiber 2 [Rhesus adenovirus 60]AUG71816.1 short fiber 2 [Rhesus adenovirus 63]AUG71830.1 short fiber 2 [Rhesus adenovirus 64]WUR08023.1 short fiber [Rhesus adenovirus 70]
MKRARIDEDYNPVYPYNTSTPPFIAPPFVDNDGFQENPQGVLSLRISKPLYFDMNKRLSLSLGQGLSTTSAGELESAQNVRANPPLSINSNTVSLRYSSPLNLTENGLVLGYSDPLRVVGGALTFNYTSPLRYENDSLTFNYTSPLKLMNNSLAIEVNSSKGVTSKNGAIAVQLSPDLKFDSNGSIAFGIQTLWTFPTTTSNCTVFTSNDSLLSLCLTKCGAHVLGSVSLTGMAGALLNMTQTSVTIQFTFDNTGSLTSSPLINNAWGIRQNDSASPNPTFNALTFMPNSTVYSRGGSGEPRNNYYTQTYLRGNIRKPIVLTVTYNSANTGYSLSFKWDAIATEKFATPTSSFCYISEQ